MNNRKQRTLAIFALIVAIISTTIAFAVLSTTLRISGTVLKKGGSWVIRFENVSNITKIGTATIQTPTLDVSNAILNFNATLSKPKDEISFTVDIKNAGTIDAELASVTLNGENDAKAKDVTFRVTYSDGTIIKIGDTLNVDEIRTLKVTVSYDDVSALTDSDITLKLGVVLNYIQRQNTTLGGETGTTNSPTLASYIKNLSSKPNSKIKIIEHAAISASNSATGKEIPATTDYRYYGPEFENVSTTVGEPVFVSSPVDNYVCLDMEGKKSCPSKHLYRIIGVFYDELTGTERVKLIKAKNLESSTYFTWNKIDDTSINENIWAAVNQPDGRGSNSVTSGSTLMTMLNNGLWWNGTSGEVWLTSGTEMVNFSENSLSSVAKNYIAPARYYLGGYSTNSVTTINMYEYERGNNRYDTARPLYWDGTVGLIYPSDLGYAAVESCVNDKNLISYDSSCVSWLSINYESSRHSSNSTITPLSNSKTKIFTEYWNAYYNHAEGKYENEYFSLGTENVDTPVTIRPVLYLKAGVKLLSGSGTISSPYLLIY